MRFLFIFMITIISIYFFPSNGVAEKDDISLILEVTDNTEERADFIEKNMLNLEVVARYDLLFDGIAIKGDLSAVKKAAQLDFVTESYPVQTYTTQHNMKKELAAKKEVSPFVLPESLNDTTFTGKGVTVGVIDTGIDYEHPDLRANFSGGFDVVDLDDDPMETREEMPTLHGTHVAGIIAADGGLEGVAPDAEILAYRALGPGGSGTSIQVIAAMEEAVRDEVDIINLSLGNTVNGPDYPTSKAVNEAAKLGVAVVVANGNDGPGNWTVGSPATSAQALSVGAYEAETEIPYLHIAKKDKKIALQSLSKEVPWEFERDYNIVKHEAAERDDIALLDVQAETIVDDVLLLQEKGVEGVIVYEEKASDIDWRLALIEAKITLPIVAVAKKDGRWLRRHAEEAEFLFADTIFEKKPDGVARFSSRGPVTVDWTLKPDIIAPGVNILSTIPGGYERLNGTSMATPHVAGAIALMKEAKPNWSNEQIFNALKTTAQQVERIDGKIAPPIEQGAGLIQVADAINTSLIIHGAPLSFGRVDDYLHERKRYLTFENTSSVVKEINIAYPKRNKGLIWNMPQTVTLNPYETKTVPIQLQTNSLLLDEGIIQDWLTITDNDKKFHVPTIVMNETSNYKKVMGFSFMLNRFDETTYNYELYLPEKVANLKVKLFDPESLLYKGTLLELSDLEVGTNKGELADEEVEFSGEFYGLMIVELENGEAAHYDTSIFIE